MNEEKIGNEKIRKQFNKDITSNDKIKWTVIKTSKKIENINTANAENTENKDIILESSLKEARWYMLLNEKFQWQFNLIYYPCCGNDITPSDWFKNKRVIFADIDTAKIDAIKKRWLEWYNVDVTKFKPEGVDSIILFNSVISSTNFVNILKKWWLILANNHLGTATELFNNNSFEFIWLLNLTWKQIELDTSNLEDCLKEVETDEELKNTPSSFWSADYSSIKNMVLKVYWTEKDLITNFKKLLTEKREGLIKIPRFLIYRIEWEEYPIFTVIDLPKKKWTADDLYIFKKIK